MKPVCLFKCHLQVLRVYYDKRQQRLNRFQGKGDEFQSVKRKRGSSSQSRERSPKVRSMKLTRVDNETGQLDKQRFNRSPDTVNQFMEEKNVLAAHSGEQNINLQTIQEYDDLETGDAGPSEDEYHSFISRCTFSKNNPTRQRRFSWTDEADR
jgi:general transcription factor 3C polypeptide 1